LGFFNLLEDAPTIRGDERVSSKVAVKRSTLSCEDCRLNEGCHSPKLRFTGEGQKQVLIVGTRPSYDEDDAGELGSGLEYCFIHDTLRQLGIDMAKDCYYTTAINCAPSKNRAPNFTEISACRSRLLSLINKLKPVSIILLGETGFDSLIEPRLSGRITGLAFSAFVGEHIPDQEYKTWLTPIWSVASMMERKSYDDGNESKPRYERDIAFYGMWKDHLYKAFNLQPVSLIDYRDQTAITQDESKAIEWIEQAMSWKRMAFDYETTGRKPHREGQKIWSVSISDGYASYSFPFFTSDKFKAAWKALMLSDVKKIAQNLSFEMLWTYVQCGYWVANWDWDTMLAQHCLSNQKPTGLKFMVYTEFGHSGYDDEVDEYLKATAAEEKLHGANAINQIHRAPMEPLLTYGALDSLYTFKLADRQSARMSAFQRKGFEFFMESAQTLTIAQANGFNVTLDKLQEVQEELDTQMLVQHQKIMGSPLLGQWTDGTFNYQSSPQLSKLLYEIMGLTPTKYTDAKKPSVDEETLAKLDVPIIKDILAYRKLFKMRNTYIAQYKTEVIGGKIHPYFNINRVDTFRSCVARGSKVLICDSNGNNVREVCIENVEDIENAYAITYSDKYTMTHKRVLWAGKTGHRNVVRLHYIGGYNEDGIYEIHLDVTPEHLIRKNDGDYIEAGRLLKEKKFQLVLGGVILPYEYLADGVRTVYAVEVLPDAVDVYDLEVEDTHNFIANEICVHNSANAPNVQNQPKRDKNAKKLLREFITPSKGNRIVEMDYKSLEVSGNCMFSKDPTLIKYLLDPTTDMHRDSAADCFMLKPEEVTKALRGDVKGQFVFAEFYGSFYKQVAKDLWETAEVHNLRQHLFDKGVKNFDDFERHIQEAERILWEDRFPVHNEWRESQWKFYQKHGYVELKTGFKCYGPMSRNNTFNTPVQGSSYHILQWTMNQVNKKVMRLERSRIIGEIHDSCIFDAHPSEQDLIDYWYWDYGTQKVREHWDWINVPLTIEKEQSEIDGSWAEMSEAGTLKGDADASNY